ncbi:MAG: ribosome small subunit-dependent GTPase A, partial [Kiritimatiellae bacterium]|nr:ribosome small subunit-dependent GTPase A [Kiritimatiellia bacterium]
GEKFCALAAEHAPGTKVLGISAYTGKNIDVVREYAAPRRTLAFVGSSGVGKSTLVNTLAGEDVMPTGEVREWDHKGRHTTTERELAMLPCGALVIDTPGMREIGLWEAHEGLRETFADVTRYFGRCRYSDCRHETEPGCAVLAAIEAGELPVERYEAYKRLEAENARDADALEKVRRSATHRFRK